MDFFSQASGLYLLFGFELKEFKLGRLENNLLQMNHGYIMFCCSNIALIVLYASLYSLHFDECLEDPEEHFAE